MCDFTEFEIEKLRMKKKIQEDEENWKSEPELETIQQEEQPIAITQ
ncbi:MAG: hypothetical protein ABJB76_05005 [Candidatus Nitrosocosmicus sp.]